MDKFSLFNYTQVSGSLKVDFNRALAQGLAPMLDEIKSNDDLDYSLIEEFVVSLGQCSNSASVVEYLYSKLSSGIQSGSGNQTLFLGILAKYTESWDKFNI